MMKNIGIDQENTYFIAEDNSGNTFKIPLEALGHIIMMNNEENDMMNSLINAIDELSAFILDLSAEFVDEHYSKEELSTMYELKSTVDDLLIDKSVLTENDVEKILKDGNLITVDETDNKYDEAEIYADNVFDSVSNESDNYFF